MPEDAAKTPEGAMTEGPNEYDALLDPAKDPEFGTTQDAAVRPARHELVVDPISPEEQAEIHAAASVPEAPQPAAAVEMTAADKAAMQAEVDAARSDGSAPKAPEAAKPEPYTPDPEITRLAEEISNATAEAAAEPAEPAEPAAEAEPAPEAPAATEALASMPAPAAGEAPVDMPAPGAETPAPAAKAEKPADWDDNVGMSMSDPGYAVAKFRGSGPMPAQNGGDGYGMDRNGQPARPSERVSPAAAAANEAAYHDRVAAGGIGTVEAPAGPVMTAAAAEATPAPAEAVPAPKKRSIMDRLLGRNK